MAKNVYSFILLAAAVYLTAAEVKKVGNRITAGRSTEQNSTVYLLDNAFTSDGVVFAFSAFFNNLGPAYIQIWRPKNSQNPADGFTLIAQWQYSAIKANRREDIYLQTYSKNGECFRVSQNDRLGLYFPEINGSVAYDFVGGNASTLQRRMYGEPVVDTEYVFDVLSWPYRFSVAAYTDTDLSQYNAGDKTPPCRSGLQIPIESDGYENPDDLTGRVGGTGATGLNGERGATGSTGIRGERGPNGALGATGQPGVSGERGATGATGSAGSTGLVGSPGAMGATGEQGSRGYTGPVGPPGATGPQGIQGERGAPGPAGNVTVVQEAVNSVAYEDCVWCTNILNPYLILAVVIWLSVVSICMFVVVLTICCRKQAKPNYQRNIATNDYLWKKYENGGFEKGPNPPEDTTYSAIEEGRTEF